MAKGRQIGEFKSDIEKVWSVVTDPNKSSWRTDIDTIEMAEDGKNYIETDINGLKTYYTIKEKIPYERYYVDFKNTKAEGSLKAIFEEKSQGCQVEFIQESESKSSLGSLFGGLLINEDRVLLRMIYDIKKYLKEI